MRDDVQAGGEQAAIDIGRDVSGGDGSRELSGGEGAITVSRLLPGTRRRWAGRFTSSAGSKSGTWSYGGRFWEKELGVVSYVSVSQYAVDPLPGRTGLIEHEYLELDPPKLTRSGWGWYGRRSGQMTAQLGKARPVAPDTEVCVTYRQSRDSNNDPFTTVTVTHSRLPVEWLDDMTAWWTWQLELAAELQP